MIALIAAGVAFILIVAIVVGVVDAAQASAWRRIAMERRAKWEARRPEYHRVDLPDLEGGDDD